MNLAMNGADAMGSVTDRPRVLRIGSKVNDGGGIEVTIGDSGTGIEEVIRHRIFDPLFTTKPTGMGMGLSICRRIIEAHGGRLWAAPGTPHGTEFGFTIAEAGPLRHNRRNRDGTVLLAWLWTWRDGLLRSLANVRMRQRRSARGLSNEGR